MRTVRPTPRACRFPFGRRGGRFRALAAAALCVVAAACGSDRSPAARAESESSRERPAAPPAPAAASVPLPHSAPTPEEAARRALDLIAAGDREALLAISLSETEFREVVYPELPASRPERNTSADFVWRGLHRKSRNSLAFTLDRYAGQRLELVAVDFLGETTDYGSYRVHRKAALTVRRPDGAETVVRLFGSMIERAGHYRIFSFVTD